MKLAAREWSKMRETMDKMREEGARERLEREAERERERQREKELLQLLHRLTAKIVGHPPDPHELVLSSTQESILDREMLVPSRQNGDRSLDRGNMTKTPLAVVHHLHAPLRIQDARAMEHTATNKRQPEVSASVVAAWPHSPLICLDPGNTYLDTVNSPTPLLQEYTLVKGVGAALEGTGRGRGGGRAALLPASAAGRLRVGHA